MGIRELFFFSRSVQVDLLFEYGLDALFFLLVFVFVIV